MRMLELFSGTGRMAAAFRERGYRTLTVDAFEQADIKKDIRQITREDIVSALGGVPDIIWASPPCKGFSVAAISKNWRREGIAVTATSDTAREGLALLWRTLSIIEWFPCAVWFVENPRGMMRRAFPERLGKRHTVTYCQYGERRMKPTDIWSNSETWTPRPACNNGGLCHEAAPRGSKTGTQGIKGAKARGALPYQLCEQVSGAIQQKGKMRGPPCAICGDHHKRPHFPNRRRVNLW